MCNGGWLSTTTSDTRISGKRWIYFVFILQSLDKYGNNCFGFYLKLIAWPGSEKTKSGWNEYIWIIDEKKQTNKIKSQFKQKQQHHIKYHHHHHHHYHYHHHHLATGGCISIFSYKCHNLSSVNKQKKNTTTTGGENELIRVQ